MIISERIGHNADFVVHVYIVIDITARLPLAAISNEIAAIRTLRYGLSKDAGPCFNRLNITDFSVKLSLFDFSLL